MIVNEEGLREFANSMYWSKIMGPKLDSEILRLEAAMETSGNPQRTQSIVDSWILLRRIRADIEIWKD